MDVDYIGVRIALTLKILFRLNRGNSNLPVYQLSPDA